MFDSDEAVEVPAKAAVQVQVTLGEYDPSFLAAHCYIVWFQQKNVYDVCNGEQTLSKLTRWGVPGLLITTPRKLTDLLETTSGYLKYIVIFNEGEDEQLLFRVLVMPQIHTVYLIGRMIPTNMQVHEKLCRVNSVDSLLGSLKTLLVDCCQEGCDYHLPDKGLSYDNSPDLMLMNDVTAIVLREEMEILEEQLRHQHRYSIALRVLKTKLNTVKKTVELLSEFYREIASVKPSSESATKNKEAFELLLDVSLYFDQHPHIVAGLELPELQALFRSANDPSWLSHKKLRVCLKAFMRSLNKWDHCGSQIDSKCRDLLTELHLLLLHAIVWAAKKTISGFARKTEQYVVQVLLCDIDVCLKLFVNFVLDASIPGKKLAPNLLLAAIASDQRIQCVLSAWGYFDHPRTSIALPYLREVDRALQIRKAYLVNTTNGLPKELAVILKERTQLTCCSYTLLRDLREDLKASKYGYPAYFIIDPSLPPAHFKQIYDACIEGGISPVVVLYNPQHLVMSKRMFRYHYAMPFVNCPSAEDVLTYILDQEISASDIHADLHNSPTAAAIPKPSSSGLGGLDLNTLEALDLKPLCSNSALGIVASIYTTMEAKGQMRDFFTLYAQQFGYSTRSFFFITFILFAVITSK